MVRKLKRGMKGEKYGKAVNKGEKGYGMAVSKGE